MLATGMYCQASRKKFILESSSDAFAENDDEISSWFELRTRQQPSRSGEDGTVMLALRRDEDGIWLVCCETVIA